MKKLILSLLVIAVLFTFQTAAAQTQKAMKIDKVVKLKLEIEYPFLLFTPNNKSEAMDGKLPMIVFLHGAGERGTDIDLVKVHGPPKIVENDKDFPFIVLSPQCPKGDRWNPLQLNLLIDNIIKNYPVDKNRIYLTGLSMGGFGTWDLAIAYPDKFAAIAPICGGSIIHAFQVEKIKNIPTWVFHGALDNVVPISNSAKIVQAAKAARNDMEFTVYPKAGHDSWTETYNNQALYEWFLTHSLLR